jgi:hypothetical protein
MCNLQILNLSQNGLSAANLDHVLEKVDSLPELKSLALGKITFGSESKS